MNKIASNTESNKDGLALIWKSILAYAIWTSIRLTFTRLAVLVPVWDSINNFFATLYIQLAAWSLGLMGHPVLFNTRNIIVQGTQGIYVGNHCLGVSAGTIFVLIILLLKGPWKGKLIYSLFGLTIIFLVNWFRVVGLVLMLKYGSKAFFHFNHSYTYLALVYGVIFILIIYFQNTFRTRYFQA